MQKFLQIKIINIGLKPSKARWKVLTKRGVKMATNENLKDAFAGFNLIFLPFYFLALCG